MPRQRSEDAGLYVLQLRILRPIRTRVLKLGHHRFEAGDYVYVGSAGNGLLNRMHWHCRRTKRPTGGRKIGKQWHIDALTVHSAVKLLGAIELRGKRGKKECAWAAEVRAAVAGSPPVPGFGSTNCALGCDSHFWRVTNGVTPLKLARKVGGKWRPIEEWLLALRERHGRRYGRREVWRRIEEGTSRHGRQVQRLR